MIPDLNISLFYSNEIKTLVGLLGSSLRKLKRSKYQNGKFQLQKQLWIWEFLHTYLLDKIYMTKRKANIFLKIIKILQTMFSKSM